MTLPRPLSLSKGRLFPLVAALVLLVVGCSQTTADPGGGVPTAPPALQSRDPSPEEMASAKERAGIADCPTSSRRVQPVADGLPDLTLDCLGGGREVRLAGLRGTPMVINIWAQWCGPCRTEAPHLAATSRDAGERIDFIGIDYADPDPAAALDFARAASWSYPQLQDRESKIKPELEIIGVPTTLFVDADGRVVYQHRAPFGSEDQLRDAIAEHLGVEL
jgi:cytochrome c biogenesis protein CcmG, thiol:disulfide interchange protein DsbE